MMGIVAEVVLCVRPQVVVTSRSFTVPASSGAEAAQQLLSLRVGFDALFAIVVPDRQYIYVETRKKVGCMDHQGWGWVAEIGPLVMDHEGWGWVAEVGPLVMDDKLLDSCQKVAGRAAWAHWDTFRYVCAQDGAGGKPCAAGSCLCRHSSAQKQCFC